MELQCRERMHGELGALAAFVVRVPDDAALVDALGEHDACRRLAVGAHRGQRHRGGLGHFCGEGFVEPLPELRQRFVGGGVLVEFAALV